MILYHGTSWKRAEKAISKGLRPRGKAAGNWQSAPSNPDCVYLTDAYAPHFCFSALKSADRECAVLAIDTSRLNVLDMVADEDALEQATRDASDTPHGTMLERTAWFRDRLPEMAANGLDYRWSLGALGTCAHVGTIPSSAIVKVARWNTRDAVLQFVFDPTITIMNYRIMGPRYRYLMAKLMGEPLPELDDWSRMAIGDEDRVDELFSKVKVDTLVPA